ncbi:MAG: DegT/DnrJ/EryC1/StrS family aminotransferase, partial [Leptospiraceae bacterium]|nr:DegT/DnrJ/EryC1/StrS family aminotransferase [Leptospiraceae bacterium]
DEMQAALLRVKLPVLHEWIERKRSIAVRYHKGLQLSGLIQPVGSEENQAYHIFPVRHPERDRLRQHLQENGIGTEIHYPVPPHRQKAMAGILEGDYPITQEIHATELSLPISFCHTDDEIDRVIETVNSF